MNYKFLHRKLVLKIYEGQMMHNETVMILDSIGEAVITHTNLGIKFFNVPGVRILNQIAQKIPD